MVEKIRKVNRMHRKKFLSFLGMAAVAAPMLTREGTKTEPIKQSLELSGKLKPTTMTHQNKWYLGDPLIWMGEQTGWITFRQRSEFELALIEFTKMFGHNPDFYTQYGLLPVPTFEDNLNEMRKSMLESSGPGLETIEQKTKAMRDEVEAWKKIKQMSPEERIRLGYSPPR